MHVIIITLIDFDSPVQKLYQDVLCVNDLKLYLIFIPLLASARQIDSFIDEI